jgi:hypothetical protein
MCAASGLDGRAATGAFLAGQDGGAQPSDESAVLALELAAFCKLIAADRIIVDQF